MKPINSSVELKKEIQKIAQTFQNSLALKFTNTEKKLFEVQRDSRVAKKCEEEFLNYLLKQKLPENSNNLVRNRLQNLGASIIQGIPHNNTLNKYSNSQKSDESSLREKKNMEDKLKTLMRQLNQFEERNQLLIDEIELKQGQIDELKENDTSENFTQFIENVFIRIQSTLQLLNPELKLEEGENLETAFGILENYIEDFKLFCNKEYFWNKLETTSF